MLREQFRRGVRIYLFVLAVTFVIILLVINATPPGKFDSLLGIAFVCFAALLVIGVLAMMLVSFLKRHLLALASAGLMLLLMVAMVATTPPELGVIWAAVGPMFLLAISITLLVGAVRRGKPGSPWESELSHNPVGTPDTE